jgi:hypothetical protein
MPGGPTDQWASAVNSPDPVDSTSNPADIRPVIDARIVHNNDLVGGRSEHFFVEGGGCPVGISRRSAQPPFPAADCLAGSSAGVPEGL